MSREPPKPAVRQRQLIKSSSKSIDSPDSCQASSIQQPSDMRADPSTRLSLNINQLSAISKSDPLVETDFLSPKKLDTKIPLQDVEFTRSSLNRRYPKKIFFIVANEFCERFSFYGMRTVLVLYFRSVLGFSDASSTISFHLFATLCYITPIMGAILADSVIGKFKTIFYLSTVYLLGEVSLVISSIYWDVGFFSKFSTFFGLLLIGIGTGGIKPCVSALGGDQFLHHEDRWRQTFFSMLYASINLGSLISMFITPVLRSDFQCVQRSDCYPYAFGLPSLLMFISILVFVAAKNQYVIVPLPEQNVIVSFCKCVWLALGRKLRCQTIRVSNSSNRIVTSSLDNSSAGSNLSVNTSEELQVTPSNKAITDIGKALSLPTNASAYLQVDKHQSKPVTRDHWLYLASDRYDSKSIEDFRAVLCILLVFLPTPVYWCLFDQQSSLWTLQATRMDGRIFNSRFVLQPDQISVANPLLLLTVLPIFEVIIYPALNRCKLLTKPLQRMTAGGFLAALTFVLSALIEIRIQHAMPSSEPQAGRASLLLVNGLPDCAIIEPTISYIRLPGSDLSQVSSNVSLAANQTLHQRETFDFVSSLEAKPIEVLTADNNLNNYQLKFRLASGIDQRIAVDLSGSSEFPHLYMGCAFDSQLERDLRVIPMPEKSVKLLYMSQANGKLMYNTFDDTLNLPEATKARVRIIYEAFGSSAQWEGRHFYLAHKLDQPESMRANKSQRHRPPRFNMFDRQGQVLLSDPLDIEVPSIGGFFSLQTNDNLLDNVEPVFLKPGTRNLIVVHQRDSIHANIKLTVLQDNDYRISILYQLAPYLLISVSEVMFSITGLEFSYANAPDSMKAVILGSFSMTVAFGNLLTVFIESLHLFTDVAHEFLFYSLLMALDMLLFAFIGYHFKPYKTSASMQN